MKCLICGSEGEDFVFKFYCSNPFCQNADIQTTEIKNEIELIILHMWEVYNIGETLEEFTNQFYSSGGKINFSPEDKRLMNPKVVEPKWLKDRMIKIL